MIYDAHQRSFSGLLEPQENQWHASDGAGTAVDGRLVAIIDSWPAETWLDLMIAKRISKDEAIERGQDLAADAAVLFGQLFPLYEAAAFAS